MKQTAQQSQTLMIQGTTSDAGKTTVVAGLCRLFTRSGYSVAPFKPQNMALNSAVTADGGEIGRSQALQAYACGIEPTTDMNPILLKPNSDTGAQVIVQGRAIQNLEAQEYHRYKPMAMQRVLESHQRLLSDYDLILVEGAGSPAEVNLRNGDIANMGFAEAVDCPVILVADIDKGGVFAQLVGTLELLSQSEQDRVVGFVINKFRGDIRLLQDGLHWLEEKTAKPVLAVLPYLMNLGLDAEDGIQASSGENTREQTALQKEGTEITNIKVLVFPHISNHTDFEILQLHPQVNLEYVGDHAQAGKSLEGADLVILPGSKSVQSDLAWMRKRGYHKQLEKHLRYGGKLIGICGGFQMLGTSLSDPLGIESKTALSDGLGYLDMSTELAPEKQLKQVSGRLLLDKSAGSGKAEINGYEIHSGKTLGPALERPLIQLVEGSGVSNEGALSEDGAIAGTYLHGLFDHPAGLKALLCWAGLPEAKSIDRNALRDQGLDRLADSIAENMNWQAFEQSTGFSIQGLDGVAEAHQSREGIA